MQRVMLKAKLHRVTVTQVHLDYEGSCAIDGQLLDAAGIREYEQIHIYNVSNGARLITYALRADEGSGIISINGAAAHKAQPGQIIIICSYAVMNEADLQQFAPVLVYVDSNNHPTQIKNRIER